jgi:hypothetical protein
LAVEGEKVGIILRLQLAPLLVDVPGQLLDLSVELADPAEQVERAVG